MQRLLFIIITSLIFSHAGYTQNLEQVKQFADEQYLQGNHHSALKEYQRVMFFDNQNRHSDIFRNIATLFYAQQNYGEALKYYDLAYRAEPDDSIKFELILQKGLCHLKQKNYLEALSELFDLPEPSTGILAKRKEFYIGTTYFGMNEYELALEHFASITDSTGSQQLSRLLEEFEIFRKKYNPRRLETMSKILPGLGQMVAGETFSGLNSMTLLGAILYYSVVTAIGYGYIDGMLVLSNWFYRYYTGGYSNAAAMGIHKTELKKGEIYSGIIEVIENHEKR